MKSIQASAVLFAKQLTSVAAFYQAVFGLEPSRSDADHVQLRFGSFELVIHQIPRQFLSSARDDTAFERRERAAVCLNFPVSDIAHARREANRLGGTIDDLPPPWAGADKSFFLGHDPEGNVFGAKVETP